MAGMSRPVNIPTSGPILILVLTSRCNTASALHRTSDDPKASTPVLTMRQRLAQHCSCSWLAASRRRCASAGRDQRVRDRDAAGRPGPGASGVPP